MLGDILSGKIKTVNDALDLKLTDAQGHAERVFTEYFKAIMPPCKLSKIVVTKVNGWRDEERIRRDEGKTVEAWFNIEEQEMASPEPVTPPPPIEEIENQVWLKANLHPNSVEAGESIKAEAEGGDQEGWKLDWEWRWFRVKDNQEKKGKVKNASQVNIDELGTNTDAETGEKYKWWVKVEDEPPNDSITPKSAETTKTIKIKNKPAPPQKKSFLPR